MTQALSQDKYGHYYHFLFYTKFEQCCTLPRYETEWQSPNLLGIVFSGKFSYKHGGGYKQL